MRFLKDNPALAAGIGLPILLTVLFALAALIPKWTVEPPRYDLLFSTQEYSNQRDYQIDLKVVGGQLRGEYVKLKHMGGQQTRLYLFEAGKLATREISFSLPENIGDAAHSFGIEETAGWKIDTSSKAPDGYEFLGQDRLRGGLLWPFSGGDYSYRAVISKSGRVVSIPPRQDLNFNYYNMRFLGWVIPPEAK